MGAEVDGAVSTNTVPTALTFKTTTTNSLTERMRITSAGDVGIGTILPLDDVAGGSSDYSGTGFHVKGAATARIVIEGKAGNA